MLISSLASKVLLTQNASVVTHQGVGWMATNEVFEAWIDIFIQTMLMFSGIKEFCEYLQTDEFDRAYPPLFILFPLYTHFPSP